MNWVEALQRCQRRPYVLVTVIEAKGSYPRGVGTRMIVDADGRRFGTLGGGNLERLVLELAAERLGTASFSRESYPLGARAGQCCGGSVEVLVESVLPAPTVVLFGAGHVGQALVRVLAATRFDVVVVEDRAEWLRSLPDGLAETDGVDVFDLGWDLFLERGPWGPHTYAVIMTHSHALDRDILAGVLGCETAYVGLIGSKTKWRTTQTMLLEQGITQAQLDQVQCPIGLRTGGKEPGDIAVSVAAQLMTLFHYADGESS